MFFYNYSSQRITVLVTILVVTVAFYYPALSSPFIFDDFYNLSGLGELKEKGYLYYLLNSSFAGPTGRPLSLFTFALQHEAWPHSPFMFKSGNLAIHLLNGVLVWLICEQFLKYRQGTDSHKLLITGLATAIWLLHPMQLTTVLYTVQRMTQLSCLFSLLAVWCYLLARENTVKKESIYSYVILAIAVLVPMLLGVLSKENAILVLPLLAVMEYTILQASNRPRYWNRWALVVIGVPMLVVVTYLASRFSVIASSFHFRDFTMTERLMTQPAVLLTYLKNILVPGYGAFTLYHDDFPISRGWLEPWYTLPAILAVLSLVILSIWQIRKLPVMGFALLWFFTAHLLESTYLNLELYFEHRNYLPSVSVCFGLAVGLVWTFGKLRGTYLPVAIASLYILLVLSVLFLESSLWNKPAVQASEWARLHPYSVRSQNYLGNLYLSIGDYDNARKVYVRMEKNSPDVLFPVLQQQRITSCRESDIQNLTSWDRTIEKSASARPIGLEIVALLDVFMLESLKGKCRDGTLAYIEGLLHILIENKHYVFVRSYLFEFLAIIALHQQDYSNALQYIDNSILAKARAETQLFRLSLLERMNRMDLVDMTFEDLEREAANNPVKQLILEQIKNEYYKQ